MIAAEIIRILIEMATAARIVATANPDDCCSESVAEALEEAVEAISGH